MRNLLLSVSVSLIAPLVCAEEMKFITTLSSPLGTFAQLETVDPGAVSAVPLVNFCNTRSSVGTVTLKGADAYFGTLNLKNGTELGGNIKEYRVSGGLNVNNNTELTGGRLIGNSVSVSGASSAKSKVKDTLYANSLKVKGAKTDNLTIPGQVQTSGKGNNDDLEWSNIYTKDYKSDGSATGTSSYTSYLLKTKGQAVCSAPGGKNQYTAPCENGKVGTITYTWDTASCTYKESGTCTAYELTHNAVYNGSSSVYFYVSSSGGCSESQCRSNGAPKSNFRSVLPQCPSNVETLCRTTGKVSSSSSVQECWDSRTQIKIVPRFTPPGCYCNENYINVARCDVKR